jgi:hypothetical protein
MAITISGSGIVEANLADNAVTLAKMASGTDGEILTYDASGNPTSVSVGTDGQVLTSTGVGSPPAFEAAAAGGKVLQVVYAQDTTQISLTSSSYTDPSIDATITPTSSTSKILVLMNGIASSGSTTNILRGKIYRDSTAVSAQTEMASYNANANARSLDNWSMSYLDSPSTTSAVRYNLRAAVIDGENWYLGRWGHDGTSSPTQITLIEIGA